MGMPGWAAALAAPYAVDKLVVDPVTSMYGLYKGIRDDQNEQNDRSQLTTDLSQFQKDPNHVVDFRNYSNPDAAMKAAKTFDSMRDTENQRRAAPVAKMLAQFAAEGNDADPNFPGDEWVKGMATTSGYMSPEEYDAMKAGAVPGAKKGSLPISAFAANPVAADLIQKAELAAQNKGTMARVFDKGAQARPLDLAHVAMNKDLASGFDNTTQGTKRLFDQGETTRGNAAEDAMNQEIANYPLTQNVASWNGLVERLRKIPGLAPDKIDKTLKDMQGRNAGPSGKRLELFATSGNATTRGNVQTDMFGNPISETKVTATNHAPQPGSTAEDKARRTQFNKDNAYLQKMENLVATGGKGMIMIDGVPTSFDGTKESVDALKSLRDEHKQFMDAEYPEEMSKRHPKKSEFPGNGNGKQTKIDAKGRPVPLAVKQLNGATYHKIGPNDTDWVKVK